MSPPKQKRCSRCKEEKPVGEFHRRNNQDGYQAYCKPCARIVCREGRAKNPGIKERQRVYERNKYRADPEAYYWRNLLRRHGLTKKAYLRLLAAQDNVCAICLVAFPEDPIADRRTQRRIYVDHDHATGAVRGLLCPACNTAVGLVKEDPTVAMRLSAFLMKNHGFLDNTG